MFRLRVLSSNIRVEFGTEKWEHIRLRGWDDHWSMLVDI